MENLLKIPQTFSFLRLSQVPGNDPSSSWRDGSLGLAATKGKSRYKIQKKGKATAISFSKGQGFSRHSIQKLTNDKLTELKHSSRIEPLLTSRGAKLPAVDLNAISSYVDLTQRMTPHPQK